MSTPSHKEKVETKFNLLPYAGNVGSAKIEPEDITFFKERGSLKTEKVLNAKFEELIKQAKDLQNSFILNKEVYDSQYRFEPIIGEIYHLYENSDGTKNLSMIGPNEWSKKYLYSVRLNSDMTWSKI